MIYAATPAPGAASAQVSAVLCTAASTAPRASNALRDLFVFGFSCSAGRAVAAPGDHMPVGDADGPDRPVRSVLVSSLFIGLYTSLCLLILSRLPSGLRCCHSRARHPRPECAPVTDVHGTCADNFALVHATAHTTTRPLSREPRARANARARRTHPVCRQSVLTPHSSSRLCDRASLRARGSA